MVNIARWFPTLILIPYFIMLMCGLMLPSDGYHGLKSPKSLSFLTTCYLVFLYFFYKKRFTAYQYKLMGFTLISVSFLLIWLTIGTIYQFGDGWHAAFDQFKIFVITLVFTVVTLYIVSEGIVKGETVIKGVVYINLAYSIIKICGVTLQFLGMLKLVTLVEATGIRIMSMEITDGISRFQTSVDIITPFLIFFVLQSKKLNLGFGRLFRIFFISVSTLSIILSFSRFLMFVGFLSAFLYWLTLSLPRLTRGLALCALLMWGAVMMVGVDETSKIIARRFDSQGNYMSDQIREEQVQALMVEYDSHQILGKGLGSSAPNYLRDGEVTHSYEVQWVAFLMQFGVVGLLFVLVPVIFITCQFLTKPLTRVNIAFIVLFLMWLLSGFTNPYLISLTSGIVYSIFLLAADMLSTNRTPIPLKKT